MIIPEDGLVITKDTIFQPGVYLLPRGISIAADHVTLDGNGSVLVGGGGNGRGLSVDGHDGVTIKNLILRDYYHGIYARRCRELTITGCRVNGTAEVPANTIFLDIWKTAVEAYGGGIFLWEVTGSTIRGNDLQHQMNGLLAYHCRQIKVEENNASYCSGFGFYLHRTSQSLFLENYADFCCRYHPRNRGTGHMGADAAGFVIVLNSSRNLFRRNYARMGGDGFFLSGLTPKEEHVGCDENLFEENDGSYSPNIAFEATFSRGNIYRNNQANHSNYGFWLGFSREFELENNQVWRNRQAGVAVENGFGMAVRGNDFRFNEHGVLLWSKYVATFAKSVPENDTSRDWLIEENQFVGNNKAIRVAADQDHGIRPLPPGTPPTPRPHHHTIRRNRIQESRIGIETVHCDETFLEENTFLDNGEEIRTL